MGQQTVAGMSAFRVGALIAASAAGLWLAIDLLEGGTLERAWLSGPRFVLGFGFLPAALIAAASAIHVRHRRRQSRIEAALDKRTSALAEERAFNQILLENAQDPILVWDREACIQNASSAAERLFGGRAGDLIGRSVTSLLDPRDRAAFEDHAGFLFGAQDDEKHFGLAISLHGLRLDGSPFPFEMHPHPILPGGRNIVVATLRTDTDCRPVEADLQHSESLRAVIDTLPDAVLVHRGMKLVYVNQSFVDLLGYARADEVLGRPLREFIHADDWAGVCARLREVEIRGKRLDPSEERFLARDGHTITLEIAKFPILLDGQPAVTAIGRDIRHRQLSDRRLRQAVESAPSGMIMTDAAGRIVMANSHVERLFGHHEIDLLGQRIEVLIPERFRKSHPALRDGYLGDPTTRRMGVGREFFALHKDGHEIPVEIILNPIPMDDGVFVLSSIVDIRERKKVESLIAMADRMSAVGTLAAGVAHGINNPLTYVKGNLQFIRGEVAELGLPRGGGAAGDRDIDILLALDHAIEGADRIRDMVGDLLTYARHEAADSSQGIDLHAVLESVTRMISNEIRHRAELEKDYGDVPLAAGDSSRLAHAFTNLLVNAAHSIPEGEAQNNRITLSTRTNPVSGFIVIEIEDTGTGIARDVLPYVFDPFFTTKSVGRGVGLGLSVSQGIINGLGGRIGIESEVGVGTRVRVELPPGRAQQSLRPGRVRPSIGHRMHILVVDDEPRVLDMIRRLLKRHHLSMATGAREALGRIGSGERFDVIFCDLMMPETTGAQLHAALRAAHPDQAERIVFMTGGAFTSDSRSFIEWVSNPVLQKPVDVEALEAAIAEVVRASDHD